MAEPGVVQDDGDDVGGTRGRYRFVGKSRGRLNRSESDLLWRFGVAQRVILKAIRLSIY
jgi:hypothetical protein